MSIDEIKRAQNIIKAYARDLEGLTVDECAAEGFSPGQCEVLVQALGKGAEGVITATDEFVLKSRHFSKEFIDALAGADGNKALQQRGAWFVNKLDVARANIEDAVPALIEALKDESAFVRMKAADALGNIKDANAVPALIEALKDESAVVRYRAAWALIQSTDASVVPALIEALKDKSAEVRSLAARALGEIGHVAAIPPLLNMAQNDPDPYCRRDAEQSLEKLKEN